MSSVTERGVTPSRTHPRDAGPQDSTAVPRKRFRPRFPLSLKLSRGRVGGLSAVALAVAGGALFVTVGGVLADTGLRANVPVERMPDADAVIAAEQVLPVDGDLDVMLPERRGLPETLVHQVEALPEVETAVGDVGFPAAVVTEDGTVSASDPLTTGRNWSSATRLDSPELSGDAPQGDNEVVLDVVTANAADAEVGENVRLVVGEHTGEYRLSGVVDTSATSVLLDDATAMELARRTDGPRAGTVDTIGVRAAPDITDGELTEAIDSGVVVDEDVEAIVHTGASRGDTESPRASAAGPLLLSLAGSLSGVVLIIVGFSIAGAISISVASQRRELALMRTMAATPRQIRRLVALPNLAATCFALPIGIGAGYLASAPLVTLLMNYGLLPPELPVLRGPVPALVACVLLPLTVWTSAMIASSRTSKVAPVEALAESTAEPRAPRPLRVRIGVALLVISVAMSIPPLFLAHELTLAATGIASLVAAIGLAMVGATLVRRIVAMVIRRLPASVSPVTWLSVQNLHGHSYRVGGAIAALAMAVTFTLGQGYSQFTMMTAGATENAEGTLAEHQVTAESLGGVPSDLTTEVRGLPTIAAAAELTHTDVVWPFQNPGMDEDSFMEQPAQVLGTDAGEVLDLGLTEGDLASLEGPTVALGSAFADLSGVELGDSVTFYLGDGEEVTPEVVALYERELGFSPVTLSPDLAAGHVTGDLNSSLLVRAEPGQEDDAIDALDQLTTQHPGVDVTSLAPTSSPSNAGGDLAEIPANMMINFVVLLALLGYMLLSVTNRLIAETLQRHTEVATLRSLGMTRAQVRSVLRRESMIIAGMATALGVLASAAPLAFAGVAFLGRPWPGGPVWLLPISVVTVVLLSWLSIEYSAARLTGKGADSQRRV